MRYWVGLPVCLSVRLFMSEETTFPLSNLKTKHIFGTRMALLKL